MLIIIAMLALSRLGTCTAFILFYSISIVLQNSEFNCFTEVGLHKNKRYSVSESALLAKYAFAHGANLQFPNLFSM